MSSMVYKGYELGGLAGADAKCQALADAAGLSGTFKAWLSSSQGSPADRFTHSDTYGYALRTGTMIASDWSDLTDGTLAAPITTDENGSYIGGGWPWTGTGPDGTLEDASNTCFNWSSLSNNEFSLGVCGAAIFTDAQWTVRSAAPCTWNGQLYCFEQ